MLKCILVLLLHAYIIILSAREMVAVASYSGSARAAREFAGLITCWLYMSKIITRN